MSGRSVRSRKCVLRVRVARICHPCGQSPGPASSAGGGRTPSNKALHVGQFGFDLERPGAPQPASVPSLATLLRISGRRSGVVDTLVQFVLSICPRRPGELQATDTENMFMC